MRGRIYPRGKNLNWQSKPDFDLLRSLSSGKNSFNQYLISKKHNKNFRIEQKLVPLHGFTEILISISNLQLMEVKGGMTV